MARKRLSMRHIKEVFRLRFELGLSQRNIAKATGLARSTVEKYLKRAREVGLSWPLTESTSESELWAKLSPPLPTTNAESSELERPLPDWKKVHRELGRKDVTLNLLWEEYRDEHPKGYARSQFYEHYGRWKETLEPTLRLVHVPGEKMFVDWAGQTIDIRDPKSGEDRRVSIFVAVLGFSQKVYAAAFENQKLPAWVSAHCKALEFYGGVPALIVPDNPKTAVTVPCRYEPQIHPTYQEMATHYGCAILPARPRKPRDKAKVETAVQIVQRQILAPMRDRKFFSLTELNQAIESGLDKLNAQAFTKLPGSRQELFEEGERDLLKPLPQVAYELATWKQAKVNIDYHVAVQKHLYSVPYRFIHQTLRVRITERMIEIHHDGIRIAAHKRSSVPGKYSTVAEHLPKSHQKHLEWSPGRLINWARSIGPTCARVVERIMESRPHPEQGYRSCLGLLRLAKTVGQQRMEAACDRAYRHQLCSFQSVKSILQNKLDQGAQQQQLTLSAPEHENVRGADYYKTEKQE